MLPERKIKFCENYVANGFNGRRAYMAAYESDNENTAGVEACNFLKEPEVIEKITEIEGNYRLVGYQLEINKKLILNRIKDMLGATKVIFHNAEQIGEVPDWTAINNAIITYAKLVGDFAPEKKSVTIDDNSLGQDPSKMTKEERIEYKKKILKELEA